MLCCLLSALAHQLFVFFAKKTRIYIGKSMNLQEQDDYEEGSSDEALDDYEFSDYFE